MTTTTADYIVVGGGLTGTVIASRLSQHSTSPKVVLLEAGTNEHQNPIIQSPRQAAALRTSQYVWNYASVPQRHLDGRTIPAVTGKMLSGSSAMNAGCWTRCSASDYDHWATLAGEGGHNWSYAGQLPYFKKSETWYDSAADAEAHGFEGPVKIHAAVENRKYPLREQVKDAFVKALGMKLNPDAQAGDPIGLSVWTENWHEGLRQPSGAVYGLERVEVLTEFVARKIVLEENDGNDGHGGKRFIAKGIELVNGQRILANKEVIVCCGAFRTPQLLMLSGIGSAQQLQTIGIEALVDNKEVGHNLHDQISLSLAYKLKDGPSKGFAMGSPLFNKPEYAFGSPLDWMAIASIDPEIVKKGLEEDGQTSDAHTLLAPDRPHTESVIAYAPLGGGIPGLQIPFDGSIITAAVLNLLPTSRGSVTLSNPDPLTQPLIDPNYYATATDRVVLRAGIRNLLKVLDSFEEGVLDGELVAEPFAPLTVDSTDEEIDKRVRSSSSTWYHFGGTAAMGKVVDTELKVVGVKGLRVADASILPCPLGGHYQAAMFGLGEQAAEIISQA